MEQQRRLIQNITKAKKSIRKKLRTLRDTKFITEHAVQESLHPVIQPIEELRKDTVESGEATRKTIKEAFEPFYQQNEDDKDIHNMSEITVNPSSATVTALDNPNFDHLYGPEVAGEGRFTLGSKDFKVTDTHIFVGNQIYDRTDDLLNLIMTNNTKIPTDQDVIDNYAEILDTTSVYREGFVASGNYRAPNSKKFRYVIRPILRLPTPPDRRAVTRSSLPFLRPRSDSDPTTGKGLFQCGNPSIPKIKNWENPNELVNRLRLLYASQEAGHTGHVAEINAIINELRVTGIIE